jgi:hypothetical protein
MSYSSKQLPVRQSRGLLCFCAVWDLQANGVDIFNHAYKLGLEGIVSRWPSPAAWTEVE